jgi:hypothetical protein
MNDNSIMNLLFPHQKEFLDEAFSPKSNKVVLLIGPPGYGKSMTLVASLAKWYQKHPESRMLLLIPTALHDQVLELLRSCGTRAFKFDRYWLRQNLDEVDSDIRLPRGVVWVANPTFAEKKDVLDILDRSSIDLVVADEAHHLRSGKVLMMEVLIAQAKKVLLATATPLETSVPGLLEEVTIIRWEHTDLLDVGGEPLFVEPAEIKPRIINFVRSDLEQCIKGSVESLVDLLSENPDPRAELFASTLMKTLESSPAAFESVFRRIRNDLAHSTSQFLILDARSSSLALSLCTDIDIWLDELSHDAKLESLGRIMADIRGLAKTGEITLIITDFAATLFYLASYLEESQIRHSVIHSTQTFNERVGEIDSAVKESKVVIATRAVVKEHFSLGNVADLIIYEPMLSAFLTDIINSLSLRKRSPIRIHLVQSVNTLKSEK